MSKTFVAINDPAHNLLRNVTRHTPLYQRITPGELPAVVYRIQPQSLPRAYFSLAVFHALEGLPLAAARRARGIVTSSEKAVVPELVNYFDAVKLDRRCCRDLRLKVRKRGPGLLAGELLCFGTGMTRACNDDGADCFQVNLWRQHGRLHTRHEVVYARIRALHRTTSPTDYQVQKEGFHSTNVIYGDALGELEQLWDRRADTVFLEQVNQTLQCMRHQAEIAAFAHPPLALDAIMQLHLRAQALWLKPPSTARILLRRLEFILSHTAIDNSPATIYHGEPVPPASPRRRRSQEQKPWEPDRSGYDGWLDGGWDCDS
jgi:hypothetical protein